MGRTVMQSPVSGNYTNPLAIMQALMGGQAQRRFSDPVIQATADANRALNLPRDPQRTADIDARRREMRVNQTSGTPGQRERAYMRSIPAHTVKTNPDGTQVSVLAPASSRMPQSSPLPRRNPLEVLRDLVSVYRQGFNVPEEEGPSIGPMILEEESPMPYDDM
tara:strand:+ start:1485 stop:1976 length:492 start_codon:yes stop_codon:yes gene_type:complete